MSILREVPVYWKCLNCGREGEYTTWDLDADPTTIGYSIRRVQVGECMYCTDGVEGPLPDYSGMELQDILKAIIEELKKLGNEVELIKKRLQLARIEGKL